MLKNIKRFALLFFFLASSTAHAGLIAVFGDNQLDNFINDSTLHTAMLVSDADIASGLAGYDAFLYTRDGSSFGVDLSAAAAAEVQSFVTGNIVLFNGDWADPFLDSAPSADVSQLWSNVFDFVVASGGGYIGEFIGSNAAFDLGLLAGSAGAQGCCDDDGLVSTVNDPYSLLSGVTMPFNPGDVEYSASLSGYDPTMVVAAYESGNPAIIANAAVPEPALLALFGIGLAGLGFARKKR